MNEFWDNSTLLCPYCGAASTLVGGDVVYPHRPDLAELKLYHCAPCEAWVGCHKKTKIPFGRLANKELRRLKQLAHAAFDPLWKEGLLRRTEAYSRLAKHLDKHERITHIGYFNEQECEEVIRWAEALLKDFADAMEDELMDRTTNDRI